MRGERCERCDHTLRSDLRRVKPSENANPTLILALYMLKTCLQKRHRLRRVKKHVCSADGNTFAPNVRPPRTAVSVHIAHMTAARKFGGLQRRDEEERVRRRWQNAILPPE